MVLAKAPWFPLIGVVGADFFFCSEWSSSMVWAFTGGALSSWQIPVCFLCVWILARPFRAVPFPKLNSPFPCPLPFPAISLSTLPYPQNKITTIIIRYWTSTITIFMLLFLRSATLILVPLYIVSDSSWGFFLYFFLRKDFLGSPRQENQLGFSLGISKIFWSSNIMKLCCVGLRSKWWSGTSFKLGMQHKEERLSSWWANNENQEK